MRHYKPEQIKIKKERTWYFLSCTLFLFLSVSISFAQNHDDIDIDQLAQDPYWHLLLHYKKTRKGFRSLADGESFFIHPRGHIEPLLEMQSNIDALFTDAPIEDDTKDPRCRFPLRYQWLQKKLQKTSYPLHAQLPCRTFQSWKSQLGTQKLYVNFASNYTNNPASMFGHTFLRLERSQNNKKLPDMLHYTVNFAAETNGHDGGITYTLKGLLGGYPGVFSTIPFYQNIQKYNHIESRDLWEYPLALTASQIDTVMDHLWELGSTFFRYYFIDENCSYFLLLLLETTDPLAKLDQHSELPFFTMPLDTIRMLKKNTSWVGPPQYRPAIEKVFFERYRQLQRKQKKATRHLLQKTFDPTYVQLSPKQQAEVLDTAIDYFAWVEHHHAKTPFQKKILLERSKMTVPNQYTSISHPKDPTEGHQTLRIGLGYQYMDQSHYANLHLRLAYHDLLDSPIGFDPVSQVEFFSFHGRLNLDAVKARVAEFKIVEIVSLYPYQKQTKKISWNVSTGYQTQPVAS
ncbi:MAG: DUF4105 domain-containing protein, partial [Deltaproteobacteria bacterium]|nr:DUF4105 domain-containing protein [Deltaproteobacteria bacterium]